MSSRLRRVAATVGPLALALGLAACTSGGGTLTARYDTVSRADVTAGVSAVGSLSAIGTENLGFAATGRLTSVRVHVGDSVRADQVLATIDSTTAKQALAQAKANVRAQRAALDRLVGSPSVDGAQATVAQANTIVDATKAQVATTADADDAAITRARAQLSTDQDARDQAESALAAIKAACAAAGGGSDDAAISQLAQQALQQLQANDTVGAAQTLAELNSRLAAGAGGSSTACSQVLTAQGAVTGAKQKVVADKTALVGAQQKKKVDAAAGKVQIATVQQAAVGAQNSLDSSAADRPHNIAAQQALLDAAEAAVVSAQKAVRDTVLRAPADGTVEVVNGAVGEYVTPSTGTTAQAPGSSAAIPGSASATSQSGATRPGGTQFLVLSNVKKLQLVLPLEQSDAAQVRTNQPVTIQPDADPNATLTGKVIAVAPASTAAAGAISYYVTVGLDEGSSALRDGQTARGTVVTVERKGVLSVPNAAVHRQGATTTVTVLADNGTQQDAPFEAGAVGAERTEVLSGLTEGQRVVLPAGGN